MAKWVASLGFRQLTLHTLYRCAVAGSRRAAAVPPSRFALLTRCLPCALCRLEYCKCIQTALWCRRWRSWSHLSRWAHVFLPVAVRVGSPGRHPQTQRHAQGSPTCAHALIEHRRMPQRSTTVVVLVGARQHGRVEGGCVRPLAFGEFQSLISETQPRQFLGSSTPTPPRGFVSGRVNPLGRASARLRQLFPQQAGSTSPDSGQRRRHAHEPHTSAHLPHSAHPYCRSGFRMKRMLLLIIHLRSASTQ